MTADRSPDATADAAAVAGSGHLTDADRATLLTPCECGHDFNHHGDLGGCWTCPELEPPRECNVLGSDLMAHNVEATVQRAVTAALNDAANAIEKRRLTRRRRWLRSHRWSNHDEARWSQGMWDAQLVISRIVRART